MDSRIDPATGDYDRSRIADLGNAVYLRITVPLGSYWADPALGSKLHLLRRMKDIARNKTLAIQYTREALQPLINDRRADRIEVDAIWNHDGRLQLIGEVYQNGKEVATFAHYVKVA
ncbi:MAG: phage GP46 family protein [Oxalobacteraceae bacterium]|nr:phage GP46 family protein [Oxalobacteraceae bacterium]